MTVAHRRLRHHSARRAHAASSAGGCSPRRRSREVRVEIERAVDDYQRRARLGDEVPLGDPPEMAHRVLRSITELGPLSELLARRDVEEVFVEGRPGHVPRH